MARNFERTRTAFAMFLLSSTGLCGCHQFNAPLSKVDVTDPAAADQLVTGFYPVEDNSFRWVARNFTVALKPPPASGKKGARLLLHLFLPEVEIRKVGPMTLTATVNGKLLGSQEFKHDGRFDFVRDITADILDTNILPIQFCFDKAMEPSKSDGRELAAVITGVALITQPEQ